MKRPNVFQKKFSILQEISKAIVFTDNTHSISNLILDLAINYCEAESGSLMLVNDQNELHILAARGVDSQFIENYRGKVGQGIAGTVAQSRQPVLVKNIDDDTRFHGKTWDHYKTKSFISCPVVSKEKLLGILNINDKRDSSFTEDELELIKIIANHAAMALENAFLMSLLKAKAADLGEINKKLIETDRIKTEFLTRISHELRTPLNSIKGAIYVLQQTVDEERSVPTEFHGIIATEADRLSSIVENLLTFLRLGDETSTLSKTVLNLRDILRELPDIPTLKTVLRNRGINLELSLADEMSPIVGDKIKVVNLFLNLLDGLAHYLHSGDTIEVGVKDLDFIAVSILLPRQLPKSVLPYLHATKHIFVTEHPEDRIKLHLARTAAKAHRWELYAENGEGKCRITLVIPKNAKERMNVYVDKSLDTFVDVISKLLDLDICSIMLSDELTGELTVKSARGLDDEIVKRTRIKFGDRIAGWVALEGKPLYIEDIERDPRFVRKSIPQYNTKSLMSLPLKLDDRVIGVINLNNKKTSEPFTEQDYKLAATVSEKISHFLKMIYTDNYRENEIDRFVASFDHLIKSQDGGQSPLQ